MLSARLHPLVGARAGVPARRAWHAEAAALLTGTDRLLVTATWTIVEVTSALVRATRVGRQGDVAVFAADTGEDGTVTLLRADPEQVQRRAVEIVRDHACGRWKRCISRSPLPPQSRCWTRVTPSASQAATRPNGGLGSRWGSSSCARPNYESLEETIAVATDAELVAAIAEGEAGLGIPAHDVEAEFLNRP